MKHPHRHTQSAFTLLEMTAAVAIVLTLGAMIFAGTRSAMDRANESRCVANLRTIGLGVHLYAADHQNSLPLPYSSQYPYIGNMKGLGGDPQLAGFGGLIPYLFPEGNKMDALRTFYCPCQPTPLRVVEADWQEKSNLKGSYNQYCGWGPGGANSSFYRNSADKTTQADRSQLLYIDIATAPGSSLVSNHRFSDNKPRGANALLINGSVKWFPAEELTFSVARADGTYLFPDPYQK